MMRYATGLFAVSALVWCLARVPTADAACVSGTGGTGCDIYLRGQYIEVGIHPLASYGTTRSGTIPSDFQAASRQSSWNNGLGFIADHDKDGNWNFRYDFSGGYFLPGYPLEGWSLEYATSRDFQRRVDGDAVVQSQPLVLRAAKLLEPTAPELKPLLVAMYGQTAALGSSCSTKSAVALVSVTYR